MTNLRQAARWKWFTSYVIDRFKTAGERTRRKILLSEGKTNLIKKVPISLNFFGGSNVLKTEADESGADSLANNKLTVLSLITTKD